MTADSKGEIQTLTMIGAALDLPFPSFPFLPLPQEFQIPMAYAGPAADLIVLPPFSTFHAVSTT